MDQINEGAAGGAGGNIKSESEEKPTGPTDGSPPKAEGNNTDEFGYEVSPGDSKEKNPDNKEKSDEKESSVKEPEKVENSISGYGDGDKPPVVAPPKEKEELPAPTVDLTEIDKAIKIEGLDEKEIPEIKSFAEKLKATPEQAKMLAEYRLGELKAAREWQKNQESENQKQILRDKAARFEELKNDKDFGGDNFKKNLLHVEKIVQDMPNAKKLLTETKGMLQPWLMRDLAVLSKRLYGSETLVNGEPNPPKEGIAEGNFLDEMYQ